MANEQLPPGLSPIMGSSLRNIYRMFKGNKMALKHVPKFMLSTFIAILQLPFRWIEYLAYDKKIKNFQIKEDPVFILGHYRSGTTFLHTLLCEDPNAAYVTTFQTIYPEMIFSGRSTIKASMRAMMPKKRPFDNMEISPDSPQEEEFALNNANAPGFNDFWYFPKKWRYLYKKYVEFEGITDAEKSKWKAGYMRVIKKAMLNTDGSRFISKNPPNTGRIREILEMFPNAKFIYIYRNPLNIFVSTHNLVETLLPSLSFQHFTQQEIDENILWMYKRMLHRYEEYKSMIPADRLVEVKYEEFETDPISWLEKIYTRLELKGFEEAVPLFEKHLDTQRNFKKNKYEFPQEVIDTVREHWSFALESEKEVRPA